MQRRRFILGVGTIVLGGSGFVASGAVDVNSIGSSGGQGWVELDSPDVDEPDSVAPGDSSDDDDEGEDHDPGGEIRVQIVRGVQDGGANRTHRLTERPRFVESSHVRGDEDGFLEGIDLGSMNVDAETWIGRTAGPQRRSNQEVAFMIANVGGVGDPSRGGQAVDITFDMFSDEAAEQPIQTDALRFPWAIDDRRGGDNLVRNTVRLAPRESIGVSIVVDGSDRAAERVRAIGVKVERIETEEEAEQDEEPPDEQ